MIPQHGTAVSHGAYVLLLRRLGADEVGVGVLEGVSKEWHTYDRNSMLAALSEVSADERVTA